MDDLALGLALAGLLLFMGLQRLQAGHPAFPWFATGLLLAILIPLTLGGGENQPLLLAALGLGLTLALILGLAASMADLATRLALLHGLTGAATALVASLALIERLLEPGWTLGLACLAILLGAFAAAGAAVTHARLAHWLPQVLRHMSQTSLGLALLLATLGLAILLAMGAREGSGWLLLFLALAAASAVTFTLPLAEREAPLAASLFGSLSGLGLALLGLALDLPALVASGILAAGLTLQLSLHLSQSVRLPLWHLLWGAPPCPEIERPSPVTSTLTLEAVAQYLREAKTVLLIPGFGCLAAEACLELITLGRHLENQGKHIRLLTHPLAGRLPGQLTLVLREAGAPHRWLLEAWPTTEPMPDMTLAIGAHDLLNPSLTSANLPDLRQATREGKEVVFLLTNTAGFSGTLNPLLEEAHVHLWQADAREGLSRLNQALAQE